MPVPPIFQNNVSAPVDPAYSRESRRFRRLEVSLPVWITPEYAYLDNDNVWELGFTRDISLGGSKIIVPPGEDDHWKAAAAEGITFIVRFENSSDENENSSENNIIRAYIRHVERDSKTNRLALGVQFVEDENKEARQAALAMGLATKKTRRRWQSAFFAALVVAGAGFFTVQTLRAEVAKRDAQITQLKTEKQGVQKKLAELSAPTLAATKSQGIDRNFERKEVEVKLADLNANIARLNDPANMNAAIKQREQAAQELGLSLAPTSKQARVQLAIAFPYGYNWPLVMNDLEVALRRKIPQVVTFQDFTMPFPDLDAREARARGKSLQVTWEPWHFSNPKAVKLSDVAAGKYDRYIDDWALAARSFGGELSIRFAHEMNGNWYPWSMAANGQNGKIWIAAYKRVVSRFRKIGASNVRWVWCFNAESVPNVPWNDAFAAYPGDEWVDAIAIDGYNFGNTTAHSKWQSFSEIFREPYQRVLRDFPRKPIYIAETGSATTGGDKVKWIKEMDVALRGPFNKIESVTWFEAAKEADWRLLSSPETVATARQVFSEPLYRRGVF
jgi:hypothetical protein